MNNTRGTKVNASLSPLENARRLCKWNLVRYLRKGDDLIFSALMSMGKSYGAIFACAQTGIPIAIFTGRGHDEQYDQIKKWCEDHGLSYYRIPSFTHDCPTYGVDERVNDLYNRGVNGSQIHERLDLPCSDGCEYIQRWKGFEPKEYDVLIGHYTHAHLPKVTLGRSVFVDEFPGNVFETRIQVNDLPGRITPFLQWAKGLPFSTFDDFITNRRDRKAVAVEWFKENGFDIPTDDLIANDRLHGKSPVIVYSLLTSDKLDNGWFRSSFSHHAVTGDVDHILDYYHMAYDPSSALYLLDPPNWSHARNVIGLDGLPTPIMWDTIIPIGSEVHQVHSNENRATYITDGLNHRYVRTTDKVKPYSSGNYVTVKRDAAVLEGVKIATGQKPGLITSRKALTKYEQEGIIRLVSETEYFGNLIGSNRMKDVRAGAVIGSSHFGDDFIKKWGAYCGRSVERQGKGNELTYGDIGDKILTHMREHQTLQAVMRFGRDGKGATVFIDTNTLPEWVPVHDRVHVSTISEGLRSVADALRGVDEWQKTEDIWNHPDVDIGYRQINKCLKMLHEGGFIEREQRGKGKVVRDLDLAGMPKYGRFHHGNSSGTGAYRLY